MHVCQHVSRLMLAVVGRLMLAVVGRLMLAVLGRLMLAVITSQAPRGPQVAPVVLSRPALVGFLSSVLHTVSE